MSSTCKASVLAFCRDKVLTIEYQHCSTIAQPYSFVKELGQGAYGCVISARHEATGEMCAVKKVRLKLYPTLLMSSILIESLLCGIDHEHFQQEDLGKEVFEGDQVVAAFPWSQERESTGLVTQPRGKAS